jgi:hypothetical protein
MINDDIEVLRLMGLDMASQGELYKWLPKDLLSYCRNFLKDDPHPLLPTNFLHSDIDGHSKLRQHAQSSPGRGHLYPTCNPGAKATLFTGVGQIRRNLFNTPSILNKNLHQMTNDTLFIELAKSHFPSVPMFGSKHPNSDFITDGGFGFLDRGG